MKLVTKANLYYSSLRYLNLDIVMSLLVTVKTAFQLGKGTSLIQYSNYHYFLSCELWTCDVTQPIKVLKHLLRRIYWEPFTLSTWIDAYLVIYFKTSLFDPQLKQYWAGDFYAFFLLGLMAMHSTLLLFSKCYTLMLWKGATDTWNVGMLMVYKRLVVIWVSGTPVSS